jgi:hypothetical protein
MRRFLHSIASALIVTAMVCPVAAAQQELPLARVAAQSGFSYSWIGAERAVEISKPGMLIVLRPGQSLFEVNDRIETTAVAPRYANNDLYISQSLANRLAQLARQPEAQARNLMIQRAAAARAEATELSAVTGAIKLEVHPLPGSEALIVSGQAPAGVPVTITLFATYSTDLPTVVVSRNDAHPDASGRFSTIVPIAPDYFRGSLMDVLATSLPGVTVATARYVVGPPNDKVLVPATAMSGDVW